MSPAADALRSRIESIRDNQAVLEAARKQAASSVGLVPFVGAGVSHRFGFPLWAEFLLSNADLAGLRLEIETLLTAGEYERAAEVILQTRGELFHLQIRHTFGKHVNAPGGAAAILPRIARSYVVTTNFDRVLETAFQDAGRPFQAIITGSRVDAVTEAIAEHRHSLLKLHGDALERSDRILTASEYERYYGPDSKLRPLLLDIYRRPMIFVGCSLRTDRPVEVLNELHRQSSKAMHFAILELPEDTRAAREREAALGESNVFPIWFPPGEFGVIDTILEDLAAAAGPMPQTAGAPANSARAPSLVSAMPANRKVVKRFVPTAAAVFLFTVAGLVVSAQLPRNQWFDMTHAREMFANAVGFSLLAGLLLVLLLARTLTQHIVLSYVRAFLLLAIFGDVCAVMTLVLGHGSMVHRVSVLAVLAVGVLILVRGGMLPFFWRRRRWADVALESVPVLLFISGVAWAAQQVMML